MSPKLSELITLLKGHRVFIQTHNFPDPDAIASAFGLQVLLERFKIPTTICHHGNVERTATANMVSEFGIKMTEDTELEDMTSDDYIITVDSQKGNANILDLVGNEVACIDHHPTFCQADYKYKDIRIVGSCATLIADYYMSYKMDMPKDVATALLYGLKMDTADFTRGVTELDIDVYKYLFPRADNSLIRKFQSGVIQYDELEAFVDSMKNIDILNGVAFAFLNFQCADAADIDDGAAFVPDDIDARQKRQHTGLFVKFCLGHQVLCRPFCIISVLAIFDAASARPHTSRATLHHLGFRSEVSRRVILTMSVTR